MCCVAVRFNIFFLSLLSTWVDFFFIIIIFFRSMFLKFLSEVSSPPSSSAEQADTQSKLPLPSFRTELFHKQLNLFPGHFSLRVACFAGCSKAFCNAFQTPPKLVKSIHRGFPCSCVCSLMGKQKGRERA